MKFSMTTAWNEAMAMFNANREVLLVVAGIFFLLPGLVTTVAFADEQAQAMAMFQQMMTGNITDLPEQPQFGAGLAIMSTVAGILQLIGTMSMLALLRDSGRPTVSDAIRVALRSLPTLLGALVLFFLGYMLVAVVAALLTGGAGMAGGGAAAGVGAIVILVVLVALVYVMTKLSLTLPVIAIDRVYNPIKAFAQSWRLTKGNSLRIFAFYLLLAIVYVVISLLVLGILMSLLGMIVGTGPVGVFILGLVSGVIGAIVSAIFVSILAAIHRQLSGPSQQAIGEVFE